ncbi:MAG: nickel-dependent lactate racemase [Candidatus Thermoplasmatota archaeon]
MQIEIPYAGDEVTVDIDEEKVNAILYPNEVEKKDKEEVILEALENPIGKPEFSQFIDDGTLFIVNDATRPTPTSRVLELMKEEIEEHEVEFIVATGSHREPTEEEYEQIFRGIYETEKDSIYHHDAKNDETVDYGETERGTPVKFNKKVREAENVVAINTVEPHYFAGFTGGRKSFLPGVASYETITQNHEFALDKEAETLRLKGNPVHEDMMEAFHRFEGEVFALNMTLDKDGDVHSATAGNMERSFLNEVEVAKEVFGVPIDQRSEVVVTAAHPIDVNLYQSHKALENGKLALKEGGIIILVSACPEGIGPRNFYDLMASMDDPENVIEKIEEEYRLGYHKAAKMVEVCSNSSIWSVSELDEENIEEAFMEPKKSIQKALDEALAKTRGKVTFLVEGGMVVPISNHL